MKIIEVLNYQDLYQKIKDQPINIKLAYKFNKLYTKIASEVIFYEESLNKIIKQYAETDDKGNFVPNESNTGILIKKEYVETCHRKIRDLQEIEVDITDIFFTLDELEDLKITPAELSCLESLIKE